MTRKNRNPEYIIQVKIARMLDERGFLSCASSGGMRTSIGTAIKNKRAGYKKGFPDIFVYEPFGGKHGLAIETKARSGQSSAQKQWQEKLEKRGYVYALARSVEEAEEVLNRYFEGSEEVLMNDFD